MDSCYGVEEEMWERERMLDHRQHRELLEGLLSLTRAKSSSRRWLLYLGGVYRLYLYRNGV